MEIFELKCGCNCHGGLFSPCELCESKGECKCGFLGFTFQKEPLLINNIKTRIPNKGLMYCVECEKITKLPHDDNRKVNIPISCYYEYSCKK